MMFVTKWTTERSCTPEHSCGDVSPVLTCNGRLFCSLVVFVIRYEPINCNERRAVEGNYCGVLNAECPLTLLTICGVEEDESVTGVMLARAVAGRKKRKSTLQKITPDSIIIFT